MYFQVIFQKKSKKVAVIDHNAITVPKFGILCIFHLCVGVSCIVEVNQVFWKKHLQSFKYLGKSSLRTCKYRLIEFPSIPSIRKMFNPILLQKPPSNIVAPGLLSGCLPLICAFLASALFLILFRFCFIFILLYFIQYIK